MRVAVLFLAIALSNNLTFNDKPLTCIFFILYFTLAFFVDGVEFTLMSKKIEYYKKAAEYIDNKHERKETPNE